MYMICIFCILYECRNHLNGLSTALSYLGFLPFQSCSLLPLHCPLVILAYKLILDQAPNLDISVMELQM